MRPFAVRMAIGPCAPCWRVAPIGPMVRLAVQCPAFRPKRDGLWLTLRPLAAIMPSAACNQFFIITIFGFPFAVRLAMALLNVIK